MKFDSNSKKVVKVAIILFVILIIVGLIHSYFSEGFIFDLLQEDPNLLVNDMGQFGIWAYFIFIFLIMFEAVFAPIPPLVIYIAGGALFGGFLAGLLGILGNFLGAGIAFSISRKFGRKWVEKKVPEKLIKKMDSFSKRKGPISIFLLRINPFTSSDLLSYAAGLTRMSFKKFLFWTIIALIPSIFLQTFIGEKIIQHTILTQIFSIVGVLYFILFFVLYFWIKSKKKKE